MSPAKKMAEGLVRLAGESGDDEAVVVVRVVVADHTQVNHGGVVYGEGETVEMPEAKAAEMLAAGIVVESGGG